MVNPAAYPYPFTPQTHCSPMRLRKRNPVRLKSLFPNPFLMTMLAVWSTSHQAHHVQGSWVSHTLPLTLSTGCCHLVFINWQSIGGTKKRQVKSAVWARIKVNPWLRNAPMSHMLNSKYLNSLFTICYLTVSYLILGRCSPSLCLLGLTSFNPFPSSWWGPSMAGRH